MEFSELEKNWQAFGERLEENTRINKRILNEMMSRKPRRRINLLRWESGIRMLLTLGLIIVFIVRFDTTIFSIRGILLIVLIVLLVLYHYFDTYQQFILASKLDVSKTLKYNNMLFLKYEQKKLWLKKMNILIYVLLIPFILYILFKIRDLGWDSLKEVIIPILIVSGVAMLFSRSRHNILQSQLQKLKDEIDELNQDD